MPDQRLPQKRASHTSPVPPAHSTPLLQGLRSDPQRRGAKGASSSKQPKPEPGFAELVQGQLPPVALAVVGGHVEAVGLVLELGGKVHSMEGLLRLAALGGHSDVQQLLLKLQKVRVAAGARWRRWWVLALCQVLGACVTCGAWLW
jgi:hypothetical protein